MHWEDRIYAGKVHPFGLRSTQKLYNAVADALLWILTNSDRVDGLHYLDDLLVLGAPVSQQCREALRRELAQCACLGVPVASRKTEGSSTRLTFLGIVMDTLSMPQSLPPSTSGERFTAGRT